ncbi:MAG: hypothetical protein ACM3U2_17175 [Deltaproteobacteria bacterium]
MAVKSVLRTLERCVTWEGFVPRKRRKAALRFLDHPELRVRARAEELLTGIPVGDHIVELTGDNFVNAILLEEEWTPGNANEADWEELQCLAEQWAR